VSAQTGETGFWDSEQQAARVEAAYLTPDVTAVRAALLDLLAPEPGWRAVDLGAGPGVFAGALLERGCRPTLVDFAPSMLERARTRLGDRAEAYLQADVASVPLPDGAFDAACIVQVLEYVDDPVAVLREAARLVRPGGVVLAADTDWDTMAFNLADRDLGRQVTRAWASTKADPWAGRRLGGWLAAAGLVPEAHQAVVLSSTVRDGNTYIEHNWPAFRRLIERRGLLGAEALDRFERGVAEAEAAGGYAFALVRHGWRARRYPPAAEETTGRRA
jgi:SAM-dependent methyltransferase